MPTDHAKLREWVFTRQGLSLSQNWGAHSALEKAGWQRSVGGVSPYLALRGRTGATRQSIDDLAAQYLVYELPSARGCTYILPESHFGLGLSLAQMNGSSTEVASARRLGVTDEELAALRNEVLSALKNGPLTPAELRSAVGDAARSLGEEGRKKGISTTLPVALGQLQLTGDIRRLPINGRLDTLRYAYELWTPPKPVLPSPEETQLAIGRLFFEWAGAATLKELREFSGMSAKIASGLVSDLQLSPLTDDPELLCLPELKDEFAAFATSECPRYAFVGNLDSFLLLRRGATFWLDSIDAELVAPTDKGEKALGTLAELSSHAVLDRGRLIGLWEYDPADDHVVCWTWVEQTTELSLAIASMESYIKEDLGDARSFSLDSPASRQPRLKVLRERAGLL